MEEKILELLAEICEDDVVKEKRDVDLFETGLLDSLGFAELLYGIEEGLGVFISPSEIERQDMDTPQKIMDLIRVRLEQ